MNSTSDSQSNRVVQVGWVTYASYYLGRVNLSPTLPALAIALGVSLAEVGTIGTAFYWVYALGQFVNGQLGNRYNPRLIVALGLVTIAVTNILFSAQSSLTAMVLLWAINGYAQSAGWAPILRIVSEHVPPERLQLVSTIMPLTFPVGTAITWVLTTYLVQQFGWESAFLIPGILVLIALIFWWASGVDTTRKQEETTAFAWRDLLRNFLDYRQWMIIAMIFGFIHVGFLLWLPTYLSTLGFIPANLIGWVAAGMQLLAILGMLLARWLVQRMSNVISALMTLSALAGSSLLLAAVSFEVLQLATLTLGFILMNGVAGLTLSSVPATMAKPGNTSALVGMTAMAFSIGSGIAGVGVGALADGGLWSILFLLWGIGLGLGAILLRWRWNDTGG